MTERSVIGLTPLGSAIAKAGLHLHLAVNPPDLVGMKFSLVFDTRPRTEPQAVHHHEMFGFIEGVHLDGSMRWLVFTVSIRTVGLSRLCNVYFELSTAHSDGYWMVGLSDDIQMEVADGDHEQAEEMRLQVLHGTVRFTPLG